MLPVAPPGRGLTRSQRVRRATANALAAAGLTEVLAYPFVSLADVALTDGDAASVALANPFDSDTGRLRRSLIPGLTRIAHRNIARGLTDLALFEIGAVYLPEVTATYGVAEVPTASVQAQFQAVAFAMRSAKDTHVAACAHAVLAQHYYPGVQVVSLVTKNVKDFGVKKLATLGIDIQRPDAFLLALFRQQPDEVSAAFLTFRQSLRSNPTVPRLLDKLASDGQMQVAAAMLAAWQQGSTVL